MHPLRALVSNTPALVAGRIARWLVRGILRRGGSAIPGRIADAIAPRMLARMLGGFDEGLVVVSGSSGKSTTTMMLAAVLRAHGLSVFTNESTANLRRGIASALVEKSDLLGRVRADIAVVEVDEAAAARLAREISPRLVVLTNVMSDQLDRFQSAQRVAGMLDIIARCATQGVVANHDDALLHSIADRLTTPLTWFASRAAVRAAQPGGLGYARENAGPRADLRPITLLDAIDDEIAMLTVRGLPLEVSLPARGVHYAMDAAAAVEAAAALLGERFDAAAVSRAFDDMRPVFGRGEVVSVDGEEIELVLVQNRASFQLNLDQLEPRPEQLFVAVGSDVRDPSWLWSVDTTTLARVDVVSGSKAHDIALRLAYAGVELGAVVPDLAEALPRFLHLPRPTVGRKTIVFTADPMRRIRRQLALTREAVGA
jgi:UDP-N-acetylmuramyl tripeptide synthase